MRRILSDTVAVEPDMVDEFAVELLRRAVAAESEAAAYRGRLRKLGYSNAGLDGYVQKYRAALKAEVKAS